MAKSKPPASLSHAGFHVFDMDKMVKFYTSVFGLKVTDRNKGQIAFLGADPKDHHQLIMVGGRKAKASQTHYSHMAFRVPDLETLKKIHEKAKRHPGVSDVNTITHGNAWSVYMKDPEGNRAEAFVDSPWHVKQPFVQPLDLSMSDKEIRAYTKQLLKRYPSAKPFSAWRKVFAERLGIT